jgi:hypothetical protein
MPTGARVGSIDAVKEFRIELAKFQESSNLALGDADSEINRICSWLERDQMSYWTAQIRKRQDLLARAEDALRYKKLFKDATGRRPSCVEEQKAVEMAKRSLAEAMEKLKHVQGWLRRVQREISLYHGGVSRFSGDVAQLIPSAMAQLGNYIEKLEKYVGIGPASLSEPVGEAASAGIRAESTGGSMARAVGEMPEDEFDPEKIRASIPPEEQLIAAKPRPTGPLSLACPIIGENQQLTLETMVRGLDAIAQDQKILFSNSAELAVGVYLLHLNLPRMWLICALEAEAAATYNTVKAGELLKGRPDLTEILKLPPGTLVAIVPAGVTVYDGENRLVLSLLN